MNNAPEQADFWQQRALSMLAERHARAADSPAEDLPTELLEMLWAFAEGPLPEEQSPELWKLARENPAARGELDRIYAAMEATADAPTGDAQTVWSHVTGPAPALATARPAPGVFDLVIQLARQGMEVLSTTGRPAFAAAAARSGEAGSKHTAALEFLTSAGTFQVVVDQVDENKVNLNVQATRTVGRFDDSELELEIRYPSHALLGTVPFVDRHARVDSLDGGIYELVLARGGEALASLYFDVKTSA